MQNKNFDIKLIIFFSFLISITINIFFLNNLKIFLGDINGELQLNLTKIILLTISLIGETSILSLIFYFGTKKFFK